MRQRRAVCCLGVTWKNAVSLICTSSFVSQRVMGQSLSEPAAAAP